MKKCHPLFNIDWNHFPYFCKKYVLIFWVWHQFVPSKSDIIIGSIDLLSGEVTLIENYPMLKHSIKATIMDFAHLHNPDDAMIDIEPSAGKTTMNVKVLAYQEDCEQEIVTNNPYMLVRYIVLFFSHKNETA